MRRVSCGVVWALSCAPLHACGPWRVGYLPIYMHMSLAVWEGDVHDEWRRMQRRTCSARAVSCRSMAAAIWRFAGRPMTAARLEGRGRPLRWANQGGCSRVTVPPAVETCSLDLGHGSAGPRRRRAALSCVVYARDLCYARSGYALLSLSWPQGRPPVGAHGCSARCQVTLEASRFSTYLRMLISRLTVDPAKRTH